jgi:hypothetical protein
VGLRDIWSSHEVITSVAHAIDLVGQERDSVPMAVDVMLRARAHHNGDSQSPEHALKGRDWQLVLRRSPSFLGGAPRASGSERSSRAPRRFPSKNTSPLASSYQQHPFTPSASLFPSAHPTEIVSAASQLHPLIYSQFTSQSQTPPT